MARNCVVALSVALFVGACGSGGDDGRATGAKGTYVAQVDPICKELQGQVGELGQDPGKQAAAIEAAVAKIKAIPKPSEDSERADVFIAALTNTYLSLQDVDQSRMVNDQPRTAKALAGAQANAKSAAAAAKLYGMQECAQTL
jgi:hypothetical protein